MSAVDLFDVIDVELEEFILHDAEVDGGLEKLRTAVTNGYDDTYRKIADTYGSNDTTSSRSGSPRPDEVEDPLGRSKAPPRPYLPQTEQTDEGFVGMLPPVG